MSDKRVLSQYDNVKSVVSQYHTDFVHALGKLKAAKFLGASDKRQREHKLSALQNVMPLLHLGKLSGGLQKDLSDDLKEKLKKWEKVDADDLQKVLDHIETEFSNTHFYDVTIDTESRQVIDIEATLKACGL